MLWGLDAKDLVANTISIYAAVVATAVAFVEIRRYLRESGKLVVTVSPRGHNAKGNCSYTFVVNVTNSGEKAIAITSVQVHSGLHTRGLRFWKKHPRFITPFTATKDGPVMVGPDDFKELTLDFGQDTWDQFNSTGAKLVISYGNPRRQKICKLKLPTDMRTYSHLLGNRS